MRYTPNALQPYSRLSFFILAPRLESSALAPVLVENRARNDRQRLMMREKADAEVLEVGRRAELDFVVKERDAGTRTKGVRGADREREVKVF